MNLVYSGRLLLPKKGPLINAGGSVLLMALILCSFLSICLLCATDSLLMNLRAQRAFESSLDLFYVAEAGLAHARAFCMTHALQDIVAGNEGKEMSESDGENPGSPFDHRIVWGGGSYFLKAYLPAESEGRSIPVQGASGLLLSISASLDSSQEKHLLVLVEEPPSCRTLAWWEPP